MPLVLNELLRLTGHTHRCETDATFGELVEESDRAIGKRHGRDDTVERRGIWPAACPVADAKVDAIIAERLQSGFGALGKLFADFDGIDGGSQLGEESCLIARASADFKYAAIGSELEPFCHFSHEGRLRNGGTAADREWVVRPRARFEVG